MKRIVAITGGIGSGKSVICHILRALGYSVYDCDSQAKLLMDSDTAMQQRIASDVCAEAITPEGINRKALSECVFSNPVKLRTLNEIVHGAVRTHFKSWATSTAAPTLFVETAILYESGFDALVNEIWEVTAPTHIRVARVVRRNALPADDVAKRIAAQSCATHPGHHIIINDDATPVLPQILSLL